MVSQYFLASSRASHSSDLTLYSCCTWCCMRDKVELGSRRYRNCCKEKYCSQHRHVYTWTCVVWILGILRYYGKLTLCGRRTMRDKKVLCLIATLIR
jgi:hypothetical protein